MKTIALTSQDLEQCNVSREEMQEPTKKKYTLWQHGTELLSNACSMGSEEGIVLNINFMQGHYSRTSKIIIHENV